MRFIKKIYEGESYKAAIIGYKNEPKNKYFVISLYIPYLIFFRFYKDSFGYRARLEVFESIILIK